MGSELEEKLARVRRALSGQERKAAYLTQPGNVSWLLSGGDPSVSLTDPPVATALVSEDEAKIFAPEFERDRLEAEEVPDELNLVYLPWEDPTAIDAAREAVAAPGETLCDAALPGVHEFDFWQLRVPLLPEEVERYRSLGAESAEAVGDTMRSLTPGMSEHEVAARVAFGLRARGIQPAVLLVGGDARLKRFRHPLPKSETIHDRVMVVVCGRRDGLYANLSRIVAFTPLDEQEQHRYKELLDIESRAFRTTRQGRSHSDVLQAIAEGYAEHGHPDAWKHHHQGGPTGYFTRDFFATPSEGRTVHDSSAYAWNPSLPGLKVEDTVLLSDQKLEVLTRDEEWPMVRVGDVERPQVLMLG